MRHLRHDCRGEHPLHKGGEEPSLRRQFYTFYPYYHCLALNLSDDHGTKALAPVWRPDRRIIPYYQTSRPSIQRFCHSTDFPPQGNRCSSVSDSKAERFRACKILLLQLHPWPRRGTCAEWCKRCGRVYRPIMYSAARFTHYVWQPITVQFVKVYVLIIL